MKSRKLRCGCGSYQHHNGRPDGTGTTNFLSVRGEPSAKVEAELIEREAQCRVFASPHERPMKSKMKS